MTSFGDTQLSKVERHLSTALNQSEACLYAHDEILGCDTLPQILLKSKNEHDNNTNSGNEQGNKCEYILMVDILNL